MTATLFPHNRVATVNKAALKHAAYHSSERLQRAITRGVYLIVRQSSPMQARRNHGSGLAQRDVLQGLERIGADPSQAHVIDARGESGQPWADRQRFNGLLRLARDGKVGVLVLATHSRAGRNDVDTLALIAAIRDWGGFVLAEGRLYDPSSEADALSLKVQAMIAEHNVRSTTDWLSAARLALATRCAHRIHLATGLIWAPHDASYTAALQGASIAAEMPQLMHTYLNERERWQSSSRDEQRVLYPSWYPDGEVLRATDLRLQWYFDTLSFSEVMHRIHRDSGWPRKGKVPRITAHCWQPGLTVEWQEIRDVKALRNWLLRPSLYGTYRFTPGSERDKQRDPRPPAVDERDVFPAFRPSSDLDAIEKTVRSSSRPRPRAKYQDVRDNTFMVPVVCGQWVGEDLICGRPLASVYAGSVKHTRYTVNDVCSRDHGFGVAKRLVDDAVLDAIASLFDPDAIEAGLAKYQVSANESNHALRVLESKVANLKPLLIGAERSEDAARAVGDSLAASSAAERARSYRSDLRSAEDELRALTDQREELRALAKHDADAIRALARDLPQLFASRDRAPDAFRRILMQCLRQVVVRPLARGVVEVEIDFRTGVTARRVVDSGIIKGTQPICAWAHARAFAGVAPDRTVAELLNHVPESHLRTLPTVGRLAGLAFRYLPVVARPGTEFEALPDLATRLHVPLAGCVSAALQSQLGELRSEAGVVSAAPTPAEIHAAFPEVARRDVAAGLTAGEGAWPLDDTASINDLSRLFAVHSRVVDDVKVRGGSGVRTDLAGRQYVRWSEAAPERLAQFMNAMRLADPSVARLDRQYWRSTHGRSWRVLRRYNRVAVADVPTSAARIELPASKHTPDKPMTLVWLGPPVICEIARQSVIRALEADGRDPSKSNEFMPAYAFIRLLHYAGLPALRHSVWGCQTSRWKTEFRILDLVRALVPDGGSLYWDKYVHVPYAIQMGSIEQVRQWIGWRPLSRASWLREARQLSRPRSDE